MANPSNSERQIMVEDYFQKYGVNDLYVVHVMCLGFPYAREDDPNEGVVLDSVWEKYFDSREKYDQLIAIKRKFDPDYIFTANSFGVDASNAPEEKYIKITVKN